MQLLKRFSLLLIVIFMLTLLTVGGVGTAKTAKAASASYPATVALLEYNQYDNSLWAVWYDQAAAFIGDRAYISHYDLSGSPFQVLSVPRSSASLPQSDFVFLPGANPRFYYPIYLPQENSQSGLLSVAYLDLLTAKTTKLSTNIDLSICRPDLWVLNRYLQRTLVYNPELNRLYMPCYADSSTKQAALVIDSATDKIVGTLPYVPLAYSAVNHRIYALQYYAYNPSSYTDGFDLLALNARTEQPSGDPNLITQQLGGSGLGSLLVNSQTGDVYLTRYSYFVKGNGFFQAAFDKSGKQTQDWSNTPTTGYLLLNAHTNQLYGRHWNGTYIAVDAANLSGGQLAAFSWTPLVVNYQYNRVYSVDNNHDGNNPFVHNHGLGVVIMDEKNFDITDFFPIFPPDGFFIQYAGHLPEKPLHSQGIFFKESGHTLSGKFLEYWQSHGGLALFGYPLTEAFLDYNPDDGKLYQVQYFERSRFELHSENAGTPYEVELGLLGKYFSATTGPEIVNHYSSGETTPIPGGLLFKESGHSLTGKFLIYWNKNGGLAIFGYPITEPFRERNPFDGQTYTVQYFERARFELHPENSGTAYEVQLGLLGRQYLRSRGWISASFSF